MGQYDVDEIEFYSNGWLDNIDLASVTNDELKRPDLLSSEAGRRHIQ